MDHRRIQRRNRSEIGARFGVIFPPPIRLVHGDRQNGPQIHLAGNDPVHILHRPSRDLSRVSPSGIARRQTTRKRTAQRIVDPAGSAGADAHEGATRVAAAACNACEQDHGRQQRQSPRHARSPGSSASHLPRPGPGAPLQRHPRSSPATSDRSPRRRSEPAPPR